MQVEDVVRVETGEVVDTFNSLFEMPTTAMATIKNQDQ